MLGVGILTASTDNGIVEGRDSTSLATCQEIYERGGGKSGGEHGSACEGGSERGGGVEHGGSCG